MKSKMTAELLAASGTMAFISVKFLPDISLLCWVFIAMLLDFLTGITKAIVLNQARTSSGYRKTIIKFTQYAGAIAVGIVLGNSLPPDNIIVEYVNSALLILLIYIEATSILENLYAMDNSSVFSKYFISPLLRVLTMTMKKASLNQTLGEDK